jgi:LysM repeat protein
VNYFYRLFLFFSLLSIVFAVTGDVSLLSADDLVHVVGKGETIYSISRFYKVSADDLMKANNISDPSKLQAGGRLKIPSSAADVPASTAAVPAVRQAQPASVNITSYRAVRGDTLYSIARSNGITLQELLELNKFSSNHVLKAGDTVKVPSRSTADNSAAVRTASGLYSLRWPVSPKDISYMTGQMGVVVEGEYAESVKNLTQGNVISAGPWRKFGRVVIVETTGGYFYMYGGCDSLSVNVGDRITPGTEVGKLGVNSVSGKPQLFFMVFQNDTPVDPALAPRTSANVKI